MTDETVTDTSETADARPAARSRFGWPSAVVALAFAVLYGYDLWEAITNAIELPRQFAQYENLSPEQQLALVQLGYSITEPQWTLIIANMLIPPVVYLFAIVLGRSRGAFGRAVFFAAGLALVAVLSLDIIAIA